MTYVSGVLVMSDTRTCPRCQTTKPLSEFGRNSSRPNGRQVYCRPCIREIDAARRAPRKESLRRSREERRAAPTKACSICGHVKLKDGGFHRYGRGDGYRSECKECSHSKVREYRASKVSPDARRRWNLRGNLAKYGLTIHAYEAMLASQGGVCAVCRRPEERLDHHTQKPRRLAVDHCHETGQVRGLLCSLCNTALGQLREDPAIIAALADYVALHTAGGGVRVTPLASTQEMT